MISLKDDEDWYEDSLSYNILIERMSLSSGRIF